MAHIPLLNQARVNMKAMRDRTVSKAFQSDEAALEYAPDIQDLTISVPMQFILKLKAERDCSAYGKMPQLSCQ